MLVNFVLFSLRVSGCAAFGTEVAAEHDYNLDAGDDHEGPPLDASVEGVAFLSNITRVIMLWGHDLNHLHQVRVAPELHDCQDDEEVDPNECHAGTVEPTHSFQCRH